MKWITFDCFGTLVDWNGGFEQIARAFAGERAAELVGAYHRREPIVEREEYRSYREVTRIALQRAAADLGLELAPPDAGSIAAHWESLPVFADTVPALKALRGAGWKLAVLTNCDDDLFAQTQAKIGVPFDCVVTAQQVRSYKPAHAHFDEFKRRENPQRWVHAARSWFHDIAPARELGIPRIWIDRDRTGEDPAAANLVLPDLRSLPQAAASFAQ